jgi:serine/threonine protein kinase
LLDIHLGNILLQLPQSFDNLSDQQIYDRFDVPDPIVVHRIDGGPLPPGVPSHVFEPQWPGVTGSNITLPESKILLADLGTAFCPALESRLESYTSLGLRPPEARFEPTTSLSFASDVWGLACAIWHIAGREPFFDYYRFCEDDVTNNQVDRLGSLPPEWWEKWETRSKHFHENGTPVPIRTPVTWEQRFEETIQQPRRKEGMGAFDQNESQAFQEMLRGMLVYRLGERLTVDQVLNTRWMREWAIPEWEKIEK